MEPRLKTELWIQALLRRCSLGGAFAAVVNRGDNTSGSVLVKVNKLDGKAYVLTSARRADGEGVWMRGTGVDRVEEAIADAYIQKTLKFDPDLWVIEIEDREGRHFLLDPVEDAGQL
jgi:hypothetical protein